MKTVFFRSMLSMTAVLMALTAPAEAVRTRFFTTIDDYLKEAEVIVIADCTSAEPVGLFRMGADCKAQATVVQTLKGKLSVTTLQVRTFEPLIPGTRYLLTSYGPVAPPEFWAHDQLGAIPIRQDIKGLEKLSLKEQVLHVFSLRAMDIQQEQSLLEQEALLLDKALHPPAPEEILKTVSREIGSDSFVPTTRVRNIPPKVIRALDEKNKDRFRLELKKVPEPSPDYALFLKKLIAEPLLLADPGEKWNATDIATPDVPTRRLIFAGSTGMFYFLEYEHGGRGKHVHLTIFQLDETDYKLVYSGTASDGYPGFQEFKKALLADPSLPAFKPSLEL